uniref:DUF6534 domain-containing protein n=1 Tax=Psilocybe cubensis TaxID=181762 RepID=A0A8H7Y4D5_PSICU
MSYVGIVLIGPLGPFLTKRTEAISFVAVIHFINTPAKSVGHVSPSSLPRSFNQLIMVVDVERTFGALLIGGIVAFNLSGLVTAQAVAYFKRYPKDFRFLKLMIVGVWFLDFLHTIFVSIALWDHLIVHFGDVSRIDFIPWSLGATVALTVSFSISSPTCNQEFMNILSQGDIDNLCAHILCSPYLSIESRQLLRRHTHGHAIRPSPLSRLPNHDQNDSNPEPFKVHPPMEMVIHFRSFPVFNTRHAVCRFTLLLPTAKPEEELQVMNNIINSLMLYTFETGMVNCAASIATLICWVTMKDNLIFLGIHFAIGKLYANSVMATLNARKDLRQTGGRPSQFSGSGTNPQAIMYPDSFTVSKGSTVKIMVDQTKVSTFE